MNKGLLFSRVIFATVIFTCLTASMLSLWSDSPGDLAFAISTSAFICLLILSIDYLFQHLTLRHLNTTIVGLFIGYLFGQALMAIGSIVMNSLGIDQAISGIATLAFFLFGCYFGLVMTLQASGSLIRSLPFLEESPTASNGKSILLTSSAVADPRLIDLAASGIIDGRLILPNFVEKELNANQETSDEDERMKAKRCLETLKRLKDLPELDIQYEKQDFPDLEDSLEKVIVLARAHSCYVLCNDVTRIQQSKMEDVRFININTIAIALKPLTQEGEHLNIKVQRYGKEARQGVGYLDDGTMVVINGGADYIGETIKSKVLSVKHTSSGRMIFCNATDEELISEQENSQTLANLDTSHKSYFAL